jgi:hypothetical protein
MHNLLWHIRPADEKKKKKIGTLVNNMHAGNRQAQHRQIIKQNKIG